MLQTKVMSFVNKIAAIVHISVVKTGGSNNKNIGDAFLFLWKIASYTETPAFAVRLQEYMKKQGNLPDDEKKAISVIADIALYSILKMIAKINSYSQILAYREHAGLNERIKDYTVKLGFGLHLGWSIEGLLGSVHKVDASYLSPHVKLADSLEACTKKYGVRLLMSDAVYKILSQEFKDKCRCIDRGTLKGLKDPMYLYTLETEIANLPKIKDRYLKMTVKERQKIVNTEKNLLFHKLMNDEIETIKLLEADKEMRRMLHFHNYASREPFIKSYKKGFKHYLKGDWTKASQYFKKCLLMDVNDGPCKALNDFIESYNCDSVSAKWPGYHQID